MSKIFNDVVSVPSREVVEEHMRRARLERSKAMWTMVSNLFSRPEAHDDESTATPPGRAAASGTRC